MAVSEAKRIRSQQKLREARGYLELTGLCDEFAPLSPACRDALARRVLAAVGELERTRQSRPIVKDIKYLTGMALRVMERHREAIDALEAAAELDAENVEIWLALGWCHKRTGRLDLAIESLQEALSIDPDQAIIYYNLACYWSLAMNTKLALEFLARSFELDESFRQLVNREPDFDPIRSDPAFLELTSVVV
jgi:tetratricopeptide (TPR) repeat protein